MNGGFLNEKILFDDEYSYHWSIDINLFSSTQ